MDESYPKDPQEEEKFGTTSVSISNYATTVVCGAGRVFCGFGAYSVQEVFFSAGKLYCQHFHPIKFILLTLDCSGLSPFLTAYEVFTNPSRVARLLLAMYQFAKCDIETLWCVFASDL